MIPALRKRIGTNPFRLDTIQKKQIGTIQKKQIGTNRFLARLGCCAIRKKIKSEQIIFGRGGFDGIGVVKVQAHWSERALTTDFLPGLHGFGIESLAAIIIDCHYEAHLWAEAISWTIR